MDWPKPIENPLKTTQNRAKTTNEMKRDERYVTMSYEKPFFMLHGYGILNYI